MPLRSPSAATTVPGVPRGIDRRALVAGMAAAGLGPARSARIPGLAGGDSGRLTILHTTDIHAQLETHEEFFLEDGAPVFRRRGGLAVLKTMVDAIRAERPGASVLVDGGDCIQGGGVAALSRGAALPPLLDRLGYDVVMPGNWEVIYGKARLIELADGLKARPVCANLHHDAGGRPGRLVFAPYWTATVGGVKLGVIGLTDPFVPRRQSPAFSRGLRFTEPRAALARLVADLRTREGCAVVVLLTHLGLAQQIDLAGAPEAAGVDWVLGGDTHERVREPIRAGGAPVTEPGAFGSFLGRLDLTVEDGRVVASRYQLLDVDPDRWPADAATADAVARVSAPYRPALARVVGRTRTTLVRNYVVESSMDNLITDAVMWRLGPDVALSNGFRFGVPIVVPPGADSAPITVEDLWRMAPVDSPVKSGWVSGRQLRAWLETELHGVFAAEAGERFGGWLVRFKGLTLRFGARRGRGERIETVTLGGRPLEPEAQYTIAACEREGDPFDTLCRLPGVGRPHRSGVTIHQVLEAYLAAHPTVAPAIEGRAVATDLPAGVLSQVDGYGYRFR